MKSTNTSFEYLYRDAGNYKTFETVVLKGVLHREDIMPFLYEGEYFIPSQVKLLDLQPDLKTELDHVWHEIVEIKSTDEKPTTPLTAKQLFAAFCEAKKDNWEKGLSASVFDWSL
jgi:hypothetical protein